MIAYQPFPISNFRVGFDEAVEPWMLPKDAFQLVKNAHLYRGVVEKINGITKYARFAWRIQRVLTPAPDGVTTTFTATLASNPISENIICSSNTASGKETFTFFGYDNDTTPTVINLRSNFYAGGPAGTGTVTLPGLVATVNFVHAPTDNATTLNEVIFQYDIFPTINTAIMGIHQYYNANGSQTIMVFNQRRMGTIMALTTPYMRQLNGCYYVAEQVPSSYYKDTVVTFNGMAATFTGNVGHINPIPGTVRFYEFDASDNPLKLNLSPLPPRTGAIGDVIISDPNGDGILTGTNVTSGFIDYNSGDFTLTMSATTNGYYLSSNVGLYQDIFSGDINNFFDVTSAAAAINSRQTQLALFTNFVDRPMYFDGQMIYFLPTNVDKQKITASVGVPNYDISRVLHIESYRERIVLLNVVFKGAIQPNYAYWSQPQAPLNYMNTILKITIGNNLPAPTAQSIRTKGVINNDMIVRFNNSERILRYTGDAFSPFRWDSTNNIWQCDAPYSDINYDSYLTSVGKPAIVGSDGVNIKRVDELIPDFTDPFRIDFMTPAPFMDQANIPMAYGERFDDIKEGWLCYNSLGGSFPHPSDSILAFNYLDGTYAVYKFSLNCLGFGTVITVPTWGSTFNTWESISDTWEDFDLNDSALVDLGGGYADDVYEVDSGESTGDGVTPVLFDIITKDFNPFIEEGQLVRLGFVDFFFTSDPNSTVRVQFYKDNQLYIDSAGAPQGYYQETILQLLPTTSSSSAQQTKIWKRIYVGAVGKEHTIRIYQNVSDLAGAIDQDVRLHAIVPYFKPAGRIFN